jgi:hypothetical protein
MVGVKCLFALAGMHADVVEKASDGDENAAHVLAGALLVWGALRRLTDGGG